MNRESVMQQVVRAVVQVQEASGRAVGGIGADTRPIGDAAGFDSLNGVEVTVTLSQSLGHELPDDNLFVSEDGRRALTIAEIADNLCRTIGVATETVRS